MTKLRPAFITLVLACAGFSAQQAQADIAGTDPGHEATSIQHIVALEKSIERQERQHGKFSSKLYAPLRELGLAQQANGDYLSAIDTFRRMQHLVHRIHGVYDQRQMESIDFIISTYYRHGDPLALDTQQNFRFLVAEKSYEPHSAEYTLAKLKLADWYRNSGRLHKATRLYAEMLKSGDMQPELKVRLLRAEALTRYLAGQSGASERLHEALSLIETSNASLVEPSQAVVDYIDMAMMERDHIAVRRSGLAPAFLGFRKPGHVLKLMAYQDAHLEPTAESYVKFTEREPGDPAVPTVGFPVSMCGNTFDSLAGRDRSPEFEVRVVVDNEGHPADISVNGDGPVKLKRYLKSSLKTGRFRPATDPNGEFTTATLSFRQTFGEVTQGVGSLSSVRDWSKLMVAQTCQVSGIQRI